MMSDLTPIERELKSRVEKLEDIVAELRTANRMITTGWAVHHERRIEELENRLGTIETDEDIKP